MSLFMRRLPWSMAVLLGLSALSSAADAPSLARWTFKAGVARRYQLSRTLNGVTPYGTAKIIQKLTLSEQAESVPETGAATIRCTVEKLSVTWGPGAGGKGWSYEYRPGAKPKSDNPVLAAHAALGGASFTADATASGEMLGISGLDSVFPDGGGSPEARIAIEMVTDLLRFQFQTVPPIEDPAASWELNVPFPLDRVIPGQSEITERVTIKPAAAQPEKGIPCFRFTSTGKFDLPEAKALLDAGAAANGGRTAGSAVGLGAGGRKDAAAEVREESTGAGRISFAKEGFLVTAKRKTSYKASLGPLSMQWNVEREAEMLDR